MRDVIQRMSCGPSDLFCHCISTPTSVDAATGAETSSSSSGSNSTSSSSNSS